MEESNVLDYLGIQLERLSTCLKEDGYKCDGKMKFNIAESEEEARCWKISHLANATQKKCEKYLEHADNEIQKKVLYLFGKDAGKEDNLLRTIHEKIIEGMGVKEDIEATKKIFTKDEHFANILYKEFCPVCSSMVDCYKSGIMKKLAINERCSTARRLSMLNFTTTYRGTWARVTVTLPCMGCCPSSESLNITSVPTIENINDHHNLLVANPFNFVEKIVIAWLCKYVN